MNHTTIPGRPETVRLGSDAAARRENDFGMGWGITAQESIRNTYLHDCVAGEFVWTGFDYLGEPTPWNGVSPGDGGRGAIPNSSYFGIVETTGFPKDSYYLYRSQWNKHSVTAHLVTAWDARNMHLTGDRLYAGFHLPYAPGTLTARAYDEEGREIALAAPMGRHAVTTPGPAAKLAARADRTEIAADGRSLVYVQIDVTDANGSPDTMASNSIGICVAGPAVIAAVDNGDQATRDKYQQASVLPEYEGIVRTLTVSEDGTDSRIYSLPR